MTKGMLDVLNQESDGLRGRVTELLRSQQEAVKIINDKNRQIKVLEKHNESLKLMIKELTIL